MMYILTYASSLNIFYKLQVNAVNTMLIINPRILTLLVTSLLRVVVLVILKTIIYISWKVNNYIYTLAKKVLCKKDICNNIVVIFIVVVAIINHTYIISWLQFALHPIFFHTLSSPPDPQTLSFPSEKSRDSRDINQHAIICYNNTVHILSYQGWTRWPSRRKGVPQTGKGVRGSPCSHCWGFHKNTKLLSMYVEDLDQIPHRLADFCEPPWIHTVGCVLVISPIPPPALLQEVRFCICTHQLLDESSLVSLMTIQLGSGARTLCRQDKL